MGGTYVSKEKNVKRKKNERKTRNKKWRFLFKIKKYLNSMEGIGHNISQNRHNEVLVNLSCFLLGCKHVLNK